LLTNFRTTREKSCHALGAVAHLVCERKTLGEFDRSRELRPAAAEQ
jgi:hypothetical protein